MTVSVEVQAAISRYLLEVSTNLGSRTPQERRELLSDLEAHIHEALARRSRDPSLKDLETVLAEMAPPGSFAEGQGGQPVQSLKRAPERQGKSSLASWALALAIGGLVGPVALHVILNAKEQYAGGEAVIYLVPLMELLALALGLATWRNTVGRAAAILAMVVLFCLAAMLAVMFLLAQPASPHDDVARYEYVAHPVEAPTVTATAPKTKIGGLEGLTDREQEIPAFSVLSADAPEVLSATWDGDHTLSVILSGNTFPAPGFSVVVGWGYGKTDVAKDSPFEIELKGLGTVHWTPTSPVGLFDLEAAAREDKGESPGLPPLPVQHSVVFAPFRVGDDPEKGGLLEFIPTPPHPAVSPQSLTLALPLFVARGRLGKLCPGTGNLRPIFVFVTESPYSKVPAMQGLKFGVDDLPPGEWGAASK